MSQIKLYGLLGWPVGHSISPQMMNAAFAKIQESATYLPFAVPSERFEDAWRGLSALGVRGVNVTIPHKTVAFQAVDTRTPQAEHAGAVNTVRFDEATGSSIGHNTDVEGWWNATVPLLSQADTELIVVGAGGAARAVLSALALYAPHVRVRLIARNKRNADQLAEVFRHQLTVEGYDWSQLQRWIPEVTWIVHTTPVGMWPNMGVTPFDTGALSAQHLVQDLIYRPSPTKLLLEAKQNGCRVQDGLDMLIYQGAAAFEWWTGQRAPIETMRNAARAALGFDRVESKSQTD